MPKIVRFEKIGGPEVLQFEEEPSKQPGKGEVRLRVKAVGLNRAESMFFSMTKYGMLGEEVIAPAYALGEYPSKLSTAEGAAIWM